MLYTNTFIQKQLNRVNAGLVEDGIIGNMTKFWIRGVQYAGDLKVDSIYGENTHNYLESIIDTIDTNTKHFNQTEFNCPCCGGNIGIHVNLLVLLESIRHYFLQPIIINSGYRCPEHNEEVDGGTTSQHLYGKAADIRVISISPGLVYTLANKMNVKGGVGEYSTFTHVDSRGTKARF